MAVAVLGALMTPQITVEGQLADLKGGGLGERVCALCCLPVIFFFLRKASEKG